MKPTLISAFANSYSKLLCSLLHRRAATIVKITLRGRTLLCSKNTLYGTIMMDTCHYAFVQNHRMCTEIESGCKHSE